MFFEKMQATASFTYIPYLEKNSIQSVSVNCQSSPLPRQKIWSTSAAGDLWKQFKACQTTDCKPDPPQTHRQAVSLLLPLYTSSNCLLSPGETHISTLKLLLKRVFHSTMCFFTCLSSPLTFWRPTCPCLSNHLQTGRHAADSSAAQPNNKSRLAILVRCGRIVSAPLQAPHPGSDYRNTQTRPTHKRGGCDETIRRQNTSRPHQPGHRCSAVFFLSYLYIHLLISFLVLSRQLSPRNIPSSTGAWRKSNSPRPAQIPPASYF